MSIPLIVSLLAGLIILLFGRQLFWLFVGIVGFIISFELATQYFAAQEEWMVLLIALVIGLLGALLAVFLQYAAVGVAGFLAGGYAVYALANNLDLLNQEQLLLWLLALVGGIIGAVLVLLLFDWALIILSASTGATLLVQPFAWDSAVKMLLVVVLIVIGVAFQAYQLSRGETVRRKRTIRRVSQE